MTEFADLLFSSQTRSTTDSLEIIPDNCIEWTGDSIIITIDNSTIAFHPSNKFAIRAAEVFLERRGHQITQYQLSSRTDSDKEYSKIVRTITKLCYDGTADTYIIQQLNTATAIDIWPILQHELRHSLLPDLIRLIAEYVIIFTLTDLSPRLIPIYENLSRISWSGERAVTIMAARNGCRIRTCSHHYWHRHYDKTWQDPCGDRQDPINQWYDRWYP